MKNSNWTLAALVLFHFACSSKQATPPPDAPVGLMASAADGSVTVSWESSAGATGYTVYYNVNSSGPVSISSLSVDAGSDLFVSISGLIDGTTYAFAVAARGLGGQGALSAQVTATPQINAPIAVAATSPADLATAVPSEPPISITFNRAATPASLTTQSASGACSGSVQLSSDSFNTCAGFTGTPVASNSNQTFAFALAQPLQGNTTYALRVTTGARDANGIALAQNYTQPHGFTTAAALTVMSVSPADGAMGIALNSTVTVVFNRSLTAASATGNTSDGNCTGSFQLSASAFASGGCIRLASVVTSGATVVLMPAQPLPPGSLVQLLVTTAVTDSNGNALNANYSSAGFNTVPPLAVASVNPDGQGNVDFLPTLSVAFASPAAPASITTNIGASTACSGSLQLSKASDDFAANTCVPMSAQPATSDGGTTFTFTPAQLLASSTSYLIRVTTAAQDPSGTPLGATYTSLGFTTRAFAVVSLDPADGSSGFARKGSITVTFNRPVGLASVGNGSCTGPFLLTLSGQPLTACIPLATPVVSPSGTQVTFTPGSFLNGLTTYQLTITTDLKDDSGGALPSAYATTTGFTTLPALEVLSTQPGAVSNVPLNTNIQVTFNQPVSIASLAARTQSQSSCGSISLTASGQSSCISFTAQPAASANGMTFTLTPAAQLTALTAYTLAITQSVTDATGAPLLAPYSNAFTTGSGVDTNPPGEVTALSATPALQSLSVSWTNPSDPDFSLVNIYLCANATTCAKSGTPAAQVPGGASAAAQTVLNGLTPYTPYAVFLTTVSQAGIESPGNPSTGATTTTGFSGVQSGAQPDFYSGQQAAALGAGDNGDTISVWFTWTNSALYTGIGNSNGTSLLTSNQDVLWIAVDTDPSVDATGESVTQSIGSNQVIWPFKADYVIQLIPNGLATTVQVHPAGGCALITPASNPVSTGCSNLQGAETFDGSSANGLDEVGIPASVFFGSNTPGPVRLAFATLNSTNGYAYALAPANPSAIDTLGYFASLTSSFNPGANIWDPTKSAQSAVLSPRSQAASLVTLSVVTPAGTTAAPTLKGSLYPLSYTLSDVSYVLRDDGTGGDVTAGDGVYTGAFNFAGVTSSLFFKFGNGSGANQVDEFPTAGVDRVWTLSGAAETLPQLSYGVVYSKNHSFTLTFQVTNPGGTSSMKEVLGNVGELGNFNPGSGAPLTLLANQTWTTAAVPFMNHDFTTTPLQWKARDDGSNDWEPSPDGTSNNHSMNDDILNSRILSWTWGDYSNDPF